MPNWMEGTLRIRGKKKDIIKFLNEGITITQRPYDRELYREDINYIRPTDARKVICALLSDTKIDDKSREEDIKLCEDYLKSINDILYIKYRTSKEIYEVDEYFEEAANYKKIVIYALKYLKGEQ